MKYEGPNFYQSKDMANVKVFADKQTDKWTNGQAKNYMTPIYRCGGIEIENAGNYHFTRLVHNILSLQDKTPSFRP